MEVPPSAIAPEGGDEADRDLLDHDAPSLDILPDAAVCAVLRLLPLADLLRLSAAAKRYHELVGGMASLWRERFEADYPTHAHRAAATMEAAANAWAEGLTADVAADRAAGGASGPSRSSEAWQGAYRRRHATERNWRNGRCRDAPALERHTGTVFGICFLSDRLALSGGVSTPDNSELVLWDLKAGRSIATPDAGELGGVFNVYSHPGLLLDGGGPNDLGALACGFRGDVALLRLSAKPPAELSVRELKAALASLDVGTAACRERSDLEEAAASCGAPLMVTRRVASLVGHVGPVVSVHAHGQADPLIATSSFDGSIKLWRLSRAGPEGAGGGAAGGAGRSGGAGAGSDGPVMLTCASSLRESVADPSLDPHHSSVGCVHFLSESTLCRGGNDMLLKTWDLRSERVTQSFPGHSGWIWSLEGVPQHGPQTVASGGTDSMIRVWDLRLPPAAACVQSALLRNAGPVGGLHARACGSQLVSGSFDGALRIWELRGGLRELALLPPEGQEGHVDRVTRIAGRGDKLLSASFDATVRQWDFAA